MRLRGDARRWWATGVLLVAAAVLSGVAATPAVADAGESIPSYQAQVDVQADGSIHVRETIQYVFAGSSHHGIYRDLRTRFTYDPDRSGSDRVRSYPVQDVQVSSPTGAPADTQVQDAGDITHIQIGSADQTVQGTQTYVLDYTVLGTFNRITTDSTSGDTTIPPHDELYWNITGDEWVVPITRATVTVSAPQAATQALCYRGVRGSTDTCDATAGSDSTFTAQGLQPGQGMSVLLAYPTGTVSDAAPIIEDRPATGLAQITRVSPYAVGGGGAAALLIAGGMALLVRRRGRDSQYVGLTPGLLPASNDSGAQALVGRRPEVAVRFTPPDDLRPGEVGTLIDEQANTVDVTATIIDLAVRGYLTIEEIEGERDWWLRVVSPAPSVELLPYELALMQAIFRGRDEVRMDDLKNTFAADLKATQSRLYDDVTARGWFRGNPQSVRSGYRVLGGGLCVLAFAVLFFGGLASVNLSVVAAGVFVGGLVVLLLAGRMPARTASGSAILAQAGGFRLYLTTAEADQIRFEEGQDLFSRYLPYAIVFGVAERWARVFDDLARQGRALERPGWYVGSSPTWTYLALGSSLNSFETTANSALVSTPAASGGSGFSSGGGFSGGGGGGGGGGSW
ncbi:MAG: DUF2207 domain-containing protein [Actinomycetota bacterium]